MSSAVVFGGSGFLGSHVADVLTGRGHAVKIFDCRLSPYLQPCQSMLRGDILDLDSVVEALGGADVVYHFAGLADIAQSARKPLETVRLNILGTANILEACRIQKIERFVFASSIYVYSHLGSFYRSSKQACEKLIQNYQEEYGLKFTILRYGSLYGPRANEFNVIRQYIEQAIRSSRIEREGDGEELREYINVLDAAEASVRILAEEHVNRFVTISGHQAMRVRDVLFMIREMMHDSIDVVFKPSLQDDPYHYAITPFSFRPEKACRYMLDTYHDLGQGLLEMLYQLYEKEHQIPPKAPGEHTSAGACAHAI